MLQATQRHFIKTQTQSNLNLLPKHMQRRKNGYMAGIILCVLHSTAL
jgi:hypothetical protein